MKRLMTLMLLIPALGASAQVKTEISEFNLSGPYAVQAPLAFDTVDVKGNKFDDKSLMNITCDRKIQRQGVAVAHRKEERRTFVVLYKQ